MSQYTAEVVPVVLEKHDNADSLSIIRIGGFTVVGRTEDWKDKDRGVYILPDTIVDTNRSEFSFLSKDAKDGKYRVKAKKLRGVPSFGLLVPAPEGAQIGDDFFEKWGLEHYNPPEPMSTGGEAISAPKIKKDKLEIGLHLSKYDIENFRKYHTVFQDNEQIFIFEKLHGCFSKYFFSEQMYCGSRTEWKKESESNIWWKTLRRVSQIEDFCKNNQNYVLYGETYGQVQDLRYGKNYADFAAFDIFDIENQRFIDIEQFIYVCQKYMVPTVPLLYNGPYSFDKVIELAEGKSFIDGANHTREGAVVRPVRERRHDKIGRVILKCVGLGYYDRK